MRLHNQYVEYMYKDIIEKTDEEISVVYEKGLHYYLTDNSLPRVFDEEDTIGYKYVFFVPYLDTCANKIWDSFLVSNQDKDTLLFDFAFKYSIPQRGRRMGNCHLLWGLKYRILKDEYGITWYPPSLLHPDYRYD